MRVIHYNREEASPVHIHAGSYASCFFIPDENVILFSEQLGTFGGSTCSITDQAELLREAQTIDKGETPHTGVKYSGIKVFEYDDTRLRELIQNARTGKDLEQKMREGFSELVEQIVEKRPEPIDPRSLDSNTRARLEALVETHVQNEHFKADFYEKLEDERAKTMKASQLEKNLRERLSFDNGGLASYMEMAQQSGLEDLARAFAEKILASSSHTVTDEQRLVAAKFLGRDTSKTQMIREDILLRDMITNWTSNTDYIGLIRTSAEAIPDERVKAVAKTAYLNLMRKGKKGNIESFLQATKLAKSLLSQEEFCRAGHAYVCKTSNKDCCNVWEVYGRNIAALKLPPEIDRDWMLGALETTANFNIAHVKEIIDRYDFSDEEIRKPINTAHKNALSHGSFNMVLSIRKEYGHLIEDQSVPTEDIELIDRIMDFYPKSD